MLPEEYKRILTNEDKFLNIGIAEDNRDRPVTWIPWKETATAMNMKLPRVFLTKEDLTDPDILSAINRKKCLGCYIFDELSDSYYSFLHQPAFHSIMDLHISKGSQFSSVDFLSKMPSLRLLYLEQVTIQKLSDLFKTEDENAYRMLDLCLVNCTVHELDEDAIQHGFISELIIFNDSYNKEEYERWNTVSSISFRYSTQEKEE